MTSLFTSPPNPQAEIEMMSNTSSFYPITASNVVGNSNFNYQNPLFLEPFRIYSLGYLVSIGKYINQPGTGPFMGFSNYDSKTQTSTVSTFFLYSSNFDETDPYLPVGDIIVPVNLITNNVWTSYNTNWSTLPVLLVKNEKKYSIPLLVTYSNFRNITQIYFMTGPGIGTSPQCSILEYNNSNTNIAVLGNVSQYSKVIAGVNKTYLKTGSIVDLGLYFTNTVINGIAINNLSGFGYYSTPFFNFRLGFPFKIDQNVTNTDSTGIITSVISNYSYGGAQLTNYYTNISTSAQNNIFYDIVPLESTAYNCYYNNTGNNCKAVYQDYCQNTNLTTPLCNGICRTTDCSQNLGTLCANADSKGTITNYLGAPDLTTCPCYLNTQQYTDYYNNIYPLFQNLDPTARNTAVSTVMDAFIPNCTFNNCKASAAIPPYGSSLQTCHNNIQLCLSDIQSSVGGSTVDSNSILSQVINCKQGGNGGNGTPSPSSGPSSGPKIEINANYGGKSSNKTAKIIAIVVIVIILIAIGVFMMKK